MTQFRTLIVGAGIAGCEAAWALARSGEPTLLVTTSLDTVYNLFEESASLAPPPGSLMEAAVRAELGEAAAGPAEAKDSAGRLAKVGSWALHRRVKQALEAEPDLHLLQSSVSGLISQEGRVTGVTTWEGVDRFAPGVALCVGSFLAARLRIGDSEEAAGRLSEMAYAELHQDLSQRGFQFRESWREAPRASGSLPYRVDFATFASGEIEQRHVLSRLQGLYAAGACVDGALDYETAARHGMRLAAMLLAQ